MNYIKLKYGNKSLCLSSLDIVHSFPKVPAEKYMEQQRLVGNHIYNMGLFLIIVHFIPDPLSVFSRMPFDFTTRFHFKPVVRYVSYVNAENSICHANVLRAILLSVNTDIFGSSYLKHTSMALHDKLT